MRVSQLYSPLGGIRFFARFQGTAFSLSIFVVVLFLGAIAVNLGQLTPLPEDFRHRFEAFESRKDEITILFMGSSITMRGVIPSEVESAMASAARSEKVYNLGISRVGDHELGVLLQRVLELKPRNLHTIVIEPWGWRDNYNHSTYRFVWWHSAQQAYAAIQAAMHHGDPVEPHLWAAILNFFNVGSFSTSLNREFEFQETSYDAGWLGYPPHMRPSRSKRRFDSLGPLWYHTHVRAYEPRRAEKLSSVDVALARSWNRLAEKHNVRLIHVLPPSLRPYTFERALAREGEIKLLLDFCRPRDFPYLFAYANHYDERHLNTSGAEAYSRLLGQALSSSPPRVPEGRLVLP